MDGIKPGYRSKDPSEIFNTRPQPGPGLSAGAMGPKKETPSLGMDGMMEPEEKSASRDDLLLTTRKLRKYIDEHLKENEKKHQKLYGDAVTIIKAMTEEIKNLKAEISSYQKALTESTSYQGKLSGEQKSLRMDVDSRNEVFQKSILDMITKQMSDMYVYTDKKFQAIESINGAESLNKAFNMGLEAAEPRFKAYINDQFQYTIPPLIKSLIQALPTPIINNEVKAANVDVHVPQTQITNILENVKLLLSEKSFNLSVDQPAPQVHFAEKAIVVEQAKNVINVPEQKALAPVVNNVVNVPEQEKPDVHIHPPRGRVKKTFTYDEMSRPKEVIEERIEEENENG